MKRLLIFCIRFYQFTISPFLGMAKCRFIPSCSEFAIQAIAKYGIFKGIWMGFRRIMRCHPWGGSGYDPVK